MSAEVFISYAAKDRGRVLAAVLDDTVIIDDVVESGSEFDTRFAGGCGVVVLGRIS
jgi:hypothetical protein